MKEQERSGWKNRLALAAITLACFLPGTGSQAYAQQFKPGDRVEVDPTGIKDWMKGTVLPFLEKDEPKFKGEYYLARVLIDKWKASYPEGVLVQLIHARPLKAEIAEPRAKPAGGDKNAPERTGTGLDLPGTALDLPGTNPNQMGAKFKPGDRVECDAAGIDSWLKGTVLPFLPKDEPEKAKDKSGKYFYIHRVRLDREASLRPEGGMCFTDRTRLLTGAAAVPPPVILRSARSAWTKTTPSRPTVRPWIVRLRSRAPGTDHAQTPNFSRRSSVATRAKRRRRKGRTAP
jgi:hypothetical protein